MRNKFDSKKNAFKSTGNFLLSTLLLHCPDILIMIRNNIIIEFNPSAEQYYGHSRHEAINKNYALLCLESGKTAINFEHETCVESHDVKWSILKASVDNDIEYIIIGKEDAPNFPFEKIEINKIKNLVVDLKLEKEKIEKDNKTLSQYLQDIVSAVPGSIYWKNKEGVYLGCNDFMVKTAGLNSTADIIGKSDAQLWPNQAIKLRENDTQVMKSGQPVRIEEEVILPNGKKRFFVVDKMPLRDPDGHLNGIIGNSMEITNLKETQAALELANQAKTMFLANMSHDIRTPLTGVISISEMLEQHLDNPDQKEEAHMLYDSGNQLLKMLNDILDDIKAGNVDEANNIKEHEFDLYQCMQDLIELELPATTFKHLDLKLDIDVNVPRFIISDKAKIHRTLLNLLGNSIKFTDTGYITIQVKFLDSIDSQARLQFSVADTGIGIAEEEKDKIFGQFYRINPSYKGIYTGHGLGLSIAQSYVKLLGGHITLTSQKGVGTTFYFDLPYKIGSSKNTISEFKNTFSEKTSTNPSVNHPNHKLSVTSRASHIDLNAPHILWVEDNPFLIKNFKSKAHAVGCRYTSANSGEQALELLKSEKFDLIISDIGLPEMSGTELSQLIRDWEKSSNKTPTPIIGLSAHAQKDVLDKCLACGMNDLLTKPINLETLQSKINQWVLHTIIEPISNSNAKRKRSDVKRLGLPDSEDKLFKLDSFPVFDPKDALKYCEIGVLIDMLKMYISYTFQDDMQLMEQAYLKKDWSKISKLAHKAQGSVGCMGLNRMDIACRYMELYYKTKQSTSLEKLYHQVIAVNSDTIDTIQAWLKKIKL